ncbi:MAG TPA: hypothetical protein VGE21_15185 [Flavobacteriales bacterium]
MEGTTIPENNSTWQRPPVLRWLCIASGIDQSFFLLLYAFGLLAAFALKDMPADEFAALAQRSYAMLLTPEQIEQLLPFGELLRTHGVLLFTIYLLRTAARMVGTVRMWNGHSDGLHIYITAQLLGVLAPMLLVDRQLFSFFGLLMVLNWCYLYWSLRHVLRRPA